MANELNTGGFNDGSDREWYFQHPKQAYQGLLSGSATLLYTAPAKGAQGPSPKARIDEIIVSNKDNASRAVTLYFVPVGGSPGDANTIFSAIPFKPNSYTRNDFQTVLEQGGMIYAFASVANVITLTISVTEYLLAKA